jgi:hypothetical protein
MIMNEISEENIELKNGYSGPFLSKGYQVANMGTFAAEPCEISKEYLDDAINLVHEELVKQASEESARKIDERILSSSISPYVNSVSYDGCVSVSKQEPNDYILELEEKIKNQEEKIVSLAKTVEELERKLEQKPVYHQGYEPTSLTEDFIFPVNREGRGSKVETLPGAELLDEIADLEYFRQRLFNGLHVPEHLLKTKQHFDKILESYMICHQAKNPPKITISKDDLDSGAITLPENLAKDIEKLYDSDMEKSAYTRAMEILE